MVSDTYTSRMLFRFHDDLDIETVSYTHLVCTDRNKMSLQGLLEYANTVDLAEIKDVIQRQIEMNSRISQEGLDNAWGAQIGKTILGNWGHDVRTEACAAAAAGSDARMSGCPLPVVINSGSGNQGITVTMPVLVYAREWKISEEKMYRALLVSNLVSIYIKMCIRDSVCTFSCRADHRWRGDQGPYEGSDEKEL